MAGTGRIKRLQKELRLLDVFAIATGATLSAGFFLLPGIAAAQAGPALILAYLVAAVPLVPAMFSIIELATAMPRAGGVYYFLDRALGPLLGTIGGLGTWLSLILKVAFALVGMGAYLALFFPELHITPVAIVIALLLGAVNLFGARQGSRLQILLVVGLLALLAVFFGGGVPKIQPEHFRNFFAAGFDAVMGTAGLVYISYVGLTKVASLSEEVRDPEKNLPRGVILALGTALLVYGVGTTLIVGLVPAAELRNNLTPVAAAARYALGPAGTLLLSIAALLAFVSVANAGMMSASRYPLAMGRDHLLPNFFRRLSPVGTPTWAILATLAALVLVILLFDPLRIAKLASAFQLLMFALVCLAVIVMRESRIPSYDPGYRSPGYPWMQLVGIFAPLYLIFEMGAVSVLFSLGLVAAAALWYVGYARQRVVRAGAIYHVFERLGRQKHDALDAELRGILREKGLREEDPFDEIVLRGLVLDLAAAQDFDAVLAQVAGRLRTVVPLSREEIVGLILEGTRVGATPVSGGVALPHFRSPLIEQPELVLVRARRGVKMTLYDPLTHRQEQEVTVHALFFLASPERNPAQHLRMLARIAERVDEPGFATEWGQAATEAELRASLLHDEHFLQLRVAAGSATTGLVDRPLREVGLPAGCLVAMLNRGRHSLVPNGDTVLREGDRLTIIGAPERLAELKRRYADALRRSRS